MEVVKNNDLLVSFVVSLVNNAKLSRVDNKHKNGYYIAINLLVEYCVKKFDKDWIDAYDWAIDMHNSISEDVMNMFYNISLEEACIKLSKNKE